MEDIELIEQIESSKVMTGSRDVNNFLEGGYEKGVVTLLYGPAASGKSNYLMLASCFLASLGKKVLYIDIEGGFCIDRIKQICREKFNNILKNIIIVKPTSFFEQKKAFIDILNETKSENISLVVVDSMTMLYRLELSDARKIGIEKVKEVNNDLANQMKALYQVSRKMNIPVLITSPVYASFLTEEELILGKEAGVSVVGGDILTYWSKCIIELQNKNLVKKAIIRKHRSLPEKEFSFFIINEGIVKRRWI